MLHFEGDRDLPGAPAGVWAKLSDARFLARCIPDAQVVGEPEPRLALAKVRPGFAFVRGTLEITLRVAEATEASSVVLHQIAKGIGASAEVEIRMAFAPSDRGTRVHWTADVRSVGGLLKMVPQGLIRGAAEKTINDVWQQVEARIAG